MLQHATDENVSKTWSNYTVTTTQREMKNFKNRSFLQQKHEMNLGF